MIFVLVCFLVLICIVGCVVIQVVSFFGRKVDIVEVLVNRCSVFC